MSTTEDPTGIPWEWRTSLSDPCSRDHCKGCRYDRCGHDCHKPEINDQPDDQSR